MAIGVISVTTIFTLSPGITISVPLGSSTAPVTSVALEDQMRFAIREGGKTVGAGVVTKIIE